MAKYNGTIVLSGMISPTDTLDQYPTHEDTLGKGGYSSVVDLTARDAISTLRRKVGMMVYVGSDGKTYQLQGGVDNSNWNEFISGTGGTTAQEELVVTAIPVSGLINTIFVGATIQPNKIIYVRGNDGLIESKVFSGTLSTVLNNNAYNDFIIVYDGTRSVIYLNNTVNATHVQLAVNAYPLGYDTIDLSLNSISTKISTLLSETYTTSLQVYAFEGIMSSIAHEANSFEALGKNKEFVVMFDGSTYSAYKKSKITISDLQTRKVLV